MGDDVHEGSRGREVFRAIVHSGLLVVGAYLVALLFVQAGATIGRSLGLGLASPSPPVTAGLISLQFVGFLVVGVWYLGRIGDRELVHIRRPERRDVGWILLGTVGLLALTLILGELLSALNVEPAANRVIEDNRDQPATFLYLTVVTILFVATGEELLFRGLVQGLFRRALGVAQGIVVASAIFGLVHLGALVGVPGTNPTSLEIGATLAVTGILGMVLGAVYEKTRSLLVPIVVHGLYNAYQFLWVYGVETGAVDALV